MDGLPSLSLQYHGLAGSVTPLNMTNHSYFNLAGHVSPQLADRSVCHLEVDAGDLSHELRGLQCVGAYCDGAMVRCMYANTAEWLP